MPTEDTTDKTAKETEPKLGGTVGSVDGVSYPRNIPLKTKESKPTAPEIGWLVESMSEEGNCLGIYMNIKRNEHRWSTVHQGALRFAREEDAQDYIDMYLSNANCKPVEHCWS